MPESSNIVDFQGSFSARKMTPTLVKRWFSSADKGNTKDLMQAAQVVMAKDWDIGPYANLRSNATSLREWSIEGEDEKTAKQIETMLRSIMPDREQGMFNFHQLIKESGKSVYFGHVVFKVETDEEGRVIHGFKPYSPATFGLDTVKRCLTYKDKNDNVHPVPSSDYYQCIPYINPHQEALCRIALILHLIKNIPAWEWASYVESFATPVTHAKVDTSGANFKKEASAMYALMKQFAGKKFAVTSKDSSLELVETTGKGAEIYEGILKYFKDRTAVLFLGTTSGLESSSRRISEIIREDLIEGDCTDISHAINQTIIKPWYVNNVNSDDLSKMPKFGFKPRKNNKQLIDNISKLNSAGYETDAKEISELSGLKVTKKSESKSQES